MAGEYTKTPKEAKYEKRPKVYLPELWQDNTRLAELHAALPKSEMHPERRKE